MQFDAQSNELRIETSDPSLAGRQVDLELAIVHDTEAESDNLLVRIDFVLQAEPKEESLEHRRERNDSNE